MDLKAPNYKFVFVSVIFAYLISQVLMVLLNSELTLTQISKYAALLQTLFFIVPIIIISLSIKKDIPIFNFIKIEYKINLKFDIVVIPCILWTLFGITLFEIGSYIIIQNILPDFILNYYNEFIEHYSVTMLELAKNNSNTISEFLLISLCITIVPAISEELLFRGYLLQNIAVRNSKQVAIFMSALLFALIHLNPISFIPIFILGIYLGALFYATNSIIPAMLLHFLNNLLVVITINYNTSYATGELETGNIVLSIGILITVISILLLFITYRIIAKSNRKFNNILTDKSFV